MDVEFAMNEAEAVFAERRLTEEERDAIWQAMAAFCLHQLESKKGPFYEAARSWLRP
jgi:hypothetical protein